MEKLNTITSFKNKDLLIITPSYPNEDNTFLREIFVKSQIEPLKQNFNKIIIISPVLFSFKILSKDKLCRDYSYNNVKVYYPRCYYLPLLCFDKYLIDNRLQVVERLINKENIRFDLIHAHFTWPSAYIGVKLKEKYNTPVIVTLHANSDRFYKEVNMNHSLLNYSWKNADALIRVNKKDIPMLKKFNKYTYSIPNGFAPQFRPLNKFECRNKLNLPADKKILFGLGLLIKRKGFNYLIDAMKIIAENRSDVLCFIGGSGPLKNKLQKQINNLNLQDQVKLTGLISNELLPVWMNACDVFVLPSLSESFGVVLIEAMACGKPVITTYNGGSEEVVISEDYGLLLEPRDSINLAKKIELALEKEWNHQEINKYVQQFTWESIATKTLDIYQKVL